MVVTLKSKTYGLGVEGRILALTLPQCAGIDVEE